MKRGRLTLFLTPLIAIILLMVGMRFYLNHEGTALSNNFMAQNFAEIERSDIPALSTRLNGVFDTSPVICAEGVRANHIFYDRTRGDCSSGLFRKVIQINRSEYGGSSITFTYGLPWEVYGFAIVILFSSLTLLGIYWWASSNIEKERQYALREIERREHEKNTAIVKATQNIAHDLKGPIGVLASITQIKNMSDFENCLPSYQSALFKLQSMASSLKDADIERIVRPNWTVLAWQNIINELQLSCSVVSIHLKKNMDIKVKIDSAKIERSISNLVINAAEAGAKNIWLAGVINGRDFAIEVIDDGPGVPDELLNHLFTRGATYRKQGGTGLGLNFVKETARGHGGDVTYRREGGRSVFTIGLPRSVNPDDIRQENKEEKTIETMNIDDNANLSEHIKSNVNASSGAQMKILLKLTDERFETEVYKYISEHFPAVKIANSINDSSFVWTNDIAILKTCITQKCPAQILSRDDSIDTVIKQVSLKLQYMG